MLSPAHALSLIAAGEGTSTLDLWLPWSMLFLLALKIFETGEVVFTIAYLQPLRVVYLW